MVVTSMRSRTGRRRLARQLAVTDHTGGTGWPAQQLQLPVSWYESIEAGTGAGYPVSGDATTAETLAAVGWPIERPA